MSHSDENTTVSFAVRSRHFRSRKVFKFRFLSQTNLHHIRREQIVFYISSLHKRIRMLLSKCRKYRDKIIKLVSV